MDHLQKAREVATGIATKTKTETPAINQCRVWRDRNYTVALVNDEHIGIAKRNPGEDRFKLITGESFAISRAVKKIFK